MDKEQRTRNQLAANVVEACDYWAKAAEQTLALHALARRSNTTATELLRGNVRQRVKDPQDAQRATELASDVRLLCAGAAGALLRPGHASSQVQPAGHRATGAHLAEFEKKLADTILPALVEQRAAAMAANKPERYAEFIIRTAMACAPVLNTLSQARMTEKAESPGTTAYRLHAAGLAIAPGVEAAAATLAACTSGQPATAKLFERAGLANFIALESASRILEADFARQRQDLVAKQQELKEAEAAERAARNQRILDAVEAGIGGQKSSFKDGLRDVLGVRKQETAQA